MLYGEDKDNISGKNNYVNARTKTDNAQKAWARATIGRWADVH
jgi:hypothetical protein